MIDILNDIESLLYELADDFDIKIISITSSELEKLKHIAEYFNDLLDFAYDN